MNGALLLSLALASLPSSKLGVHVLANPLDPDALTLLEPCPRVAKWAIGSGQEAGAIAQLHGRCPSSHVVVRSTALTPSFSTSDDPTASADLYWQAMSLGLAGIVPDGFWLEGPNERQGMPDWAHDPQAASWYAAFWSRLADRIHDAGYKPLVGSIATGEPALADESSSGANLFEPIADAMKEKSYAWGWSYHAYSQNLGKDVASELAGALRYRLIRDECGLQGVPLILSEGGQAHPGWRERSTSAETYLDWLAWLDDQLSLTSDVLGIALYQVGDRGSEAGFDLGPIAESLAEHIGTYVPDDGTGNPDGGTVEEDGGPAGTVISSPVPTGEYESQWGEDGGCGCGSTTAGPLIGAALLALGALALRPRSRPLS